MQIQRIKTLKSTTQDRNNSRKLKLDWKKSSLNDYLNQEIKVIGWKPLFLWS
jgi:hypothetical protein